MLLILGAIGLYCLISAAVVVVLCVNSSRLSAQEGWQEDWSTADLQPQQADAPQRVGGEATARA